VLWVLLMSITRQSTPPVISTDIEGHGHYACRAWQFDQLIARYLPSSPAALRADLNERGQDAGITYDDVTEVSALLMILGEYDGMVS